MALQIRCGTESRRQLVKDSPDLNGIDYLEVYTSTVGPGSDNKILIIVYCFKSNGLAVLNENNVLFSGGVRVREIKAEWVQVGKAILTDLDAGVDSIVTQDLVEQEKTVIREKISEPERVLVIRPSEGGDFSTYNLSLVFSSLSKSPPEGFVYNLSDVDFSFKVECPSEFDCVKTDICPPLKMEPEPVIDYMAKDFASFRRLILDHLSSAIPNWRDRNPTEWLIAAIEVLCYVPDQISQFQDFIAGEAYLSTARKRSSVIRHARLLDYFPHNGCNGRTPIIISTSLDRLHIKKGTICLTRPPLFDTADTVVSLDKVEEWINNDAEPFETMQDITLYAAHNEILFYNWGETNCCLAKGATSATIRNDDYKFDVPLFVWEEVAYGIPNLEVLDDLVNFLIQNFSIGWLKADSLKINVLSDKLFELTAEINWHLYFLMNDTKTVVRVANDIHGVSLICEIFAKPKEEKTLVYTHSLRVGDFLVFEEVCSPTTYRSQDSDIFHRQLVRLSKIIPSRENLSKGLIIHLLEIEWKDKDALLFPLCIEVSKNKLTIDGKVEGEDPGSIVTVSVARGNVVLADQGFTSIKPITPSSIQPPLLEDSEIKIVDDSGASSIPVFATEFLGFALPYKHGMKRFRPRLSRKPLTFAGPFDRSLPASAIIGYDVHDSVPEIEIFDGEGHTWFPSRDLLGSNMSDLEFVVEVEDDGEAFIRFKNLAEFVPDHEYIDRSNISPSIELIRLYAKYRTGNGVKGNVGVETITNIAIELTGIPPTALSLRNYSAVSTGLDMEDKEVIRQVAPFAFKTQERAVTVEDWVNLLKQFKDVQNAIAVPRWTGSGPTIFVSVDRVGGKPIDEEFKENIRCFLDYHRLAGSDVEITDPAYVPIHIKLNICTERNYSPENVKKKLQEVFSNHDNQDCTRGLFHPDNWTFQVPVSLGNICQAQMKVKGVGSCYAESFHRHGIMPNGELENGIIIMKYYEIARLDNDPNCPENGKIIFNINGGEVS